MPAQIANLFLLEDLQDASRTRELAESDRNALGAVADWTRSFVARPHSDLGRAYAASLTDEPESFDSSTSTPSPGASEMRA